MIKSNKDKNYEEEEFDFESRIVSSSETPEDYEAELDELLSSLEGLDRVREEIAWVRMYFELEPVGAESLACHLCCEDSFLSVAHTAGVRKELDVRILGDVGEEVVVSIVELDTLHCYCDHLCL